MRHETTREERVDSFEVNVDDLERLLEKLSDEFSNKDNIRISIELEFGQDSWEFENVHEIRNTDEISNERCYKFQINMSCENENLSIDEGFFTDRFEISARGDKASWCAGIIDVTKACLKNHRTPLYWIGKFWAIFILFSLLGVVLMIYVKPSDLETLNGIISLFIFCLLFMVWSRVKKKLAPPGVIFLKGEPEKSGIKYLIKEWSVYIGFIALSIATLNGLVDLLN